MWPEETNQKRKGKKKVQMKDVEEAIKACDGIVERQESSGVRKKRRKASVECYGCEVDLKRGDFKNRKMGCNKVSVTNSGERCRPFDKK